MIALKNNGAWTLALAAVLLSGCGILKKKQPEPAASVTAPVATPAPTPAAPAPEPAATVADEAVPAPEDFEDEAFEKVTDKTYKTELATLKQEIEAK